jgi:cobalamin synthase
MSIILSIFVVSLTDTLSWGLYFLFAAATAVFSIFLKVRLFERERHAERGNSLSEYSEQDSARTRWRTFILYLLLIIPFLFAPAILAMVLSPMVWFTSLNGYILGMNIGELLLYFQEKRR